jgi:TolA-binding protein
LGAQLLVMHQCKQLSHANCHWVVPYCFVMSAVCAQAAECQLLNEQLEQLQNVSLEAQQLRDQVQQLRQATADLPALRDELQELQDLLTTRQQLQQEARDADQLRQQVQALREAQVNLAALREELQQLQATHDEAITHVQELKLKVGPDDSRDMLS